MVLFGNANKDKETVQLWKDKYYKLKKKYEKEHGELEAVKKYKEEYESLIEGLAFIKKRYEDLLKREEKLCDAYKKELDVILDLAKE